MQTNILNLVKKLSTPIEESEWKEKLSEPLKADYRYFTEVHSGHEQDLFFIMHNNLPKQVSQKQRVLDKIADILFLYADNNLDGFDDSYWFFIGKLNGIKNQYYFSYETKCSGSGFGLGEKSQIYISQSLDSLVLYALTEKQRNLINED
jgi:hypothetical protein